MRFLSIVFLLPISLFAMDINDAAGEETDSPTEQLDDALILANLVDVRYKKHRNFILNWLDSIFAIDCDRVYRGLPILVSICKGNIDEVVEYTSTEDVDLFQEFFHRHNGNLGTVLHVAIRHNQLQIVDHLLKVDELLEQEKRLRDINSILRIQTEYIKEPKNMYPLRYALFNKLYGVAALLIERGADIRRREWDSIRNRKRKAENMMKKERSRLMSSLIE